jgi:hypothetical protein
MSDTPAILVISLDRELHWGVHDRVNLNQYRRNLESGRNLVTPFLDLFEKYGIRATGATVGCCSRGHAVRSTTFRRPGGRLTRTASFPSIAF